ncbi:MAG: hypothetical protein P9L91_08075 [Candidatus Zophobacter franzmannii]|nr:hypothetical protein [Candidatus Zophobacter franzmannii]
MNQCLKQYIEANPSKSEQSIKHYFIEKCYINEATLNKAYEKLQKWNREKVIIRQPENNKKSKRFHQFNSEKGTGNDNNKVFIEQKYVVFAYDVTNNKDMQITISNSRSVLKFDGKTLIYTTVQDLVKGDLFFDYSNENKESLYELINNNSVILKKIELSSKRWKQILHRIMYGYDYELEKRILQELRVKKNYIIRTWLDKKSRIKYPSQPRFKKLVKIYCDFNLLINTEANELISYQNQYVSMMNSIGRHFSNEIHDILKNNGKNHLTYYINEFVVEYKKEYPVMAQFSSKEALKIIETNSPELRFIRKIEIV